MFMKYISFDLNLWRSGTIYFCFKETQMRVLSRWKESLIYLKENLMKHINWELKNNLSKYIDNKLKKNISLFIYFTYLIINLYIIMKINP